MDSVVILELVSSSGFLCSNSGCIVESCCNDLRSIRSHHEKKFTLTSDNFKYMHLYKIECLVVKFIPEEGLVIPDSVRYIFISFIGDVSNRLSDITFPSCEHQVHFMIDTDNDLDEMIVVDSGVVKWGNITSIFGDDDIRIYTTNDFKWPDSLLRICDIFIFHDTVFDTQFQSETVDLCSSSLRSFEYGSYGYIDYINIVCPINIQSLVSPRCHSLSIDWKHAPNIEYLNVSRCIGPNLDISVPKSVRTLSIPNKYDHPISIGEGHLFNSLIIRDTHSRCLVGDVSMYNSKRVHIRSSFSNHLVINKDTTRVKIDGQFADVSDISDPSTYSFDIDWDWTISINSNNKCKIRVLENLKKLEYLHIGFNCYANNLRLWRIPDSVQFIHVSSRTHDILPVGTFDFIGCDLPKSLVSMRLDSRIIPRANWPPSFRKLHMCLDKNSLKFNVSIANVLDWSADISIHVHVISYKKSKRDILNVDFMVLTPIEFYNRFMKKQMKVRKSLSGSSKYDYEPLIVEIINSKCNRIVTRSMNEMIKKV